MSPLAQRFVFSPMPVVEATSEPGQASALCDAIRDYAIPEIIRPYPGFVAEIVLLADDDPNHVTAIRLWQSKADGDAFYETGFAKVSARLGRSLVAKPQRRDCEVAAWVNTNSGAGPT